MANTGGAVAASELRELTSEELVLRLKESKEELFNLRFQMATGQLDNNRRLRTVRSGIARIYTIMRERELGLSLSPDDTAPDDTVAVEANTESEG
ncbi:MAG: 50S ribosomal protein L29, partial [Pseudonocardiaceae bacterium]